MRPDLARLFANTSELCLSHCNSHDVGGACCFGCHLTLEVHCMRSYVTISCV
jgi:hypothetical protein